jgi:hypothetical protein
MRKIAFLVLGVVITVAAGVTLTRARSATPPVTLLDALPDGTAVAVIDFQKIAGSGLWTTIQDKFKGEIDKAQSEVEDLGLRLNDVHTVALLFSAEGMKTPTLALTGGFEQTDLLARLRASGKVKLTSEKYKGIDIYKARPIRAGGPTKDLSGTKSSIAGSNASTGDETSFVFYDANTLVTGSLDSVRASIDVKTGARPGLTQNTKLTEALAQNPAAAIRFAFALTPGLTGDLRSRDLPVDFSSISLIFGAIEVGSGLDLNATLRSDNAEHAKAISDSLNSLLAMAGSLLGSTGNPKMAPIAEALKTVSIVCADADVKITGQVPMELLNSLLSSSSKKGQ